MLVEDKRIRDNLVGGGKKEKKRKKNHKYCHLEGSLQAATKQNNTEQKKTKKQTNKQVGSLLTDPDRIYFYSCE
jgi:hypothetical protein